jgi:hypothetical protein
MKKYLLGRTETGRPLTIHVIFLLLLLSGSNLFIYFSSLFFVCVRVQAKNYVETMDDILTTPQQKLESLKTASLAHVQQITSCQV